jgi:predicted small metal-binding protein
MPDDKVLRCDCGHEVRGHDEAELVEDTRWHARNAHGIAFSIEEALLVVLRSQLDLSRESIAMGMPDGGVPGENGGSS